MTVYESGTFLSKMGLVFSIPPLSRPCKGKFRTSDTALKQRHEGNEMATNDRLLSSLKLQQRRKIVRKGQRIGVFSNSTATWW